MKPRSIPIQHSWHLVCHRYWDIGVMEASWEHCEDIQPSHTLAQTA